MAKVVLLNKPFDVLCQFTDRQDRTTLAEFVDAPELRKVYPAGRLDRDSEGLVVLTDDGKLQHAIAHPTLKQAKEYWVQLEGVVSDGALQQLSRGVELRDGLTKPATATRIDAPDVWERVPPIRERKHIPTTWISLSLREGKNRQVRRMTAAVGFPTLRLIRFAVGPWSLRGPSGSDLLAPGSFVVINHRG